MIYKLTIPGTLPGLNEYTAANRKRDKDNIAFAKKFIFDALVENHVIPNDGWKNIDSFSDSFKVDTQHPRVEVEIHTVDEDKN